VSPKHAYIEMGWPDLADAETGSWIAVLPVAAVEQHGPHLPLGVDSFIAEAYLAELRKRLPEAAPVTLLPVQMIGQSEEHLAFPGTLTLPAPVVLSAWTAIAESLLRAGIRRLVVVTSHGGNTQVVDLMARDLRARCGMLVVAASWHRLGYPDGLFDPVERKHGIHGGDIETSIMLAARPDLVRMERAADFTPATLAMEKEFTYLSMYRPSAIGWMTQDINASGAVGNATLATAEKGRAALAHGAQAFVQLLDEVARYDLARLAEGPLG
jgi:creatinine amidohydrolase